MDEFGSRIAHSDTPTVAMVPFFHILTQMSYSVIWPLCNLQYGGQLLAKSKQNSSLPLYLPLSLNLLQMT